MMAQTAHEHAPQDPIPDRLPTEYVRAVARILPTRALSAMAAEWLFIGGAMAAAHLVDHWSVSVVAIIIIGARQHALTVLGHDASHYRLLPNRALNEWASNIVLMWPMFISTGLFRRNHSLHHIHLGGPKDGNRVLWNTHDSRGRQTDEWTFPKPLPRLVAMVILRTLRTGPREALEHLTTALRDEAGLTEERAARTELELLSYLVNLMDQMPGKRAPRLWELRAPVRPARAPADWERTQVRATEQILHDLYKRAPALRTIHDMRAERPDECSWLFRNTFSSMVFAFSYRVPSYMRWLCETSMLSAYQEYRGQLQALRWRAPGGRLVLKDPCHIWHLDALLTALPTARVIRLHRDEGRCVPSMASLCHTLGGMHSAHSDPTTIGPYVREMVDRGLESERKFRDNAVADTIIDVQYQDLIQDPVRTVLQLHMALELPVPRRGEQRLRQWLDKDRAQPRQHHSYSAMEFGL